MIHFSDGIAFNTIDLFLVVDGLLPQLSFPSLLSSFLLHRRRRSAHYDCWSPACCGFLLQLQRPFLGAGSPDRRVSCVMPKRSSNKTSTLDGSMRWRPRHFATRERNTSSSTPSSFGSISIKQRRAEQTKGTGTTASARMTKGNEMRVLWCEVAVEVVWTQVRWYTMWHSKNSLINYLYRSSEFQSCQTLLRLRSDFAHTSIILRSYFGQTQIAR